jgi:hypothetical protein
MRVVTVRHRFRLLRPAAGWPPDLLDEYGRWYAAYYRRHKKNLDSGKISAREFTHRVFRDTIRKTASELEMEYTEETQ